MYNRGKLITGMLSSLLVNSVVLANTPISEIQCYVDPIKKMSTEAICMNGHCPSEEESFCADVKQSDTVLLKYFHKNTSKLLYAAEYPCIGQSELDVCLAFQGVAVKHLK